MPGTIARADGERDVQGYRPDSYGDGFADVYDDWYGALPGLGDTVRTVRRLADGGPVLELGCGTGRLAIPLAELGTEVHGLDASAAMLDRLRTKTGGDGVTVHLGDMAEVEVGDAGPFAVVFVAFNTLFNLPSEALQRRCFAQVAARLTPGGRFAVECFVPGDAPDTIRDAVEVHTLDAARVVLRISRQDPVASTLSGQHVEFTESGGVRLRPWHLRYGTPEDLDHFAAEAGMHLEARWADWSGRPFDGESTAHVSVYRSGTAPGAAG